MLFAIGSTKLLWRHNKGKEGIATDCDFQMDADVACCLRSPRRDLCLIEIWKLTRLIAFACSSCRSSCFVASVLNSIVGRLATIDYN